MSGPQDGSESDDYDTSGAAVGDWQDVCDQAFDGPAW